jgi:hypothetical protein
MGMVILACLCTSVVGVQVKKTCSEILWSLVRLSLSLTHSLCLSLSLSIYLFLARLLKVESRRVASDGDDGSL